MTQYDFGVLDPGQTSGAELAELLGKLRDAILSGHLGNSRPGYAAPGLLWVQGSGASLRLNLFNGVADIGIPLLTGADYTGRIKIRNTGPSFELDETDTNTSARFLVSGGIAYLQAGATGEGPSASSGSLYLSGWNSNDLAVLKVKHSGTWRDVWHSGNHGQNSGLDADKLDGLHASSFLRSDAGDIAISGSLKSSKDVVAQRTNNDSVFRMNLGEVNVWSLRRKHSNNMLQFYGYDTAPALVQFEHASQGLMARIVPMGDVSSSANLLSRFAGDARYLRNAAAFQSAELAFAGNTRIAAAHGLGRVPHLWKVVLRCKVANNGYAVGDEIPLPGMVDADGGRGTAAWANATSLSVFVDVTAIQNSQADFVWPTVTDWRVVFYAW